ncbi:MAG: hypothetical protein ACERJ1_17330 [Halodesulfovibrio sp.]|uniref:hypothetical protein n=1 Tax=Halodesulfovibrio sp. TaxID=1912772 RepID=UPI00359D0F49
MTCLRKEKKRSLYYDEEKKQYIKIFTPKMELKLKYWTGLRQYPGLNFAHIAKRLQAIGLRTPLVTAAEKYRVTTQAIEAPTLEKYLKDTNDPTIKPRLIELIASILNSGIVFFDFHYGNFLYKDEEIYVIDLEGYSDSIFVSRGRSGVLYRIEKHLGLQFRQEVEKRWTNVTLALKISDVFQTVRGKK